MPLDVHFSTASPGVRAAFDRLREVVADRDVAIVAQRTRIVFAAPMRFLAVRVRRDRLEGHVFLEARAAHRVVTEVVPDAYGSGLVVHRFVIRRPEDVDEAFTDLLRASAARVGRRERLIGPRR